MNQTKINARRNFLKYLAGSPLLTALPSMSAFSADADPSSSQILDLISEAKDALDVFELEAVARQVLPPAHWGYLSGGLGDDGSIQANRDAFAKYHMRPRRLVGVENVDMSVELFGTKWDTPIILCPAGSQGAYHPSGELATAAAAREKGHQMILSTVSSNNVTDVAQVYDGPLWFQLYSQTNFNVTRGLVRKAEEAGCPVIVVTVDQIVFGNSDTQARLRRQDTRDCSNCHTGERKPNFDGLPQSTGLRAGLNWDIVLLTRKSCSKESSPPRMPNSVCSMG
jgi:4-hydroxymandelate oxidase